MVRQHDLSVSIHAPRAGRDQREQLECLVERAFQSTRPVRGATRRYSTQTQTAYMFQSTRPVRGATGASLMTAVASARFQSTRPVRGATPARRWSTRASTRFNPRAPCGARHLALLLVVRLEGVSIHAPRAGRDASAKTVNASGYMFQSTRPVRGATGNAVASLRLRHRFQSTRPVRGATCLRLLALDLALVSIHAPRAGRDGRR